MIIKICAFIFFFLPPLLAEELHHPFSQINTSTNAFSTHKSLRNGERLEYDIYWGVIKVGQATLIIDSIVEIDSRPAFHIVSDAVSSSFINNFYPVNDRNEAWMDTEKLNSYGYYKKISEGKFFFNEWVVFDNSHKLYYGEKMNRKRQTSRFEGLLEYEVNDVLSALYRVRASELKTGNTLRIDVNSKKNWRLDVKIHKTEKINTYAGEKKCFLVEPMVGEEGLFVAKKGKRMLVWFTQDELRLPVILKAEIFIGSITAKLARVW